MIVRNGTVFIAIIVLCFMLILLMAGLIVSGGFKYGASIAGFFSFQDVRRSEPNCDCEYSTGLQDFICNSFCGDLSGTSCTQKSDCII